MAQFNVKEYAANSKAYENFIHLEEKGLKKSNWYRDLLVTTYEFYPKIKENEVKRAMILRSTKDCDMVGMQIKAHPYQTAYTYNIFHPNGAYDMEHDGRGWKAYLDEGVKKEGILIRSKHWLTTEELMDRICDYAYLSFMSKLWDKVSKNEEFVENFIEDDLGKYPIYKAINYLN